MKIKITRGVGIAGAHYNPGDTADLPDELAFKIVRIGKAEIISAKAGADTSAPPETIETREPDIEHRDPQPAHVGGRKKNRP